MRMIANPNVINFDTCATSKNQGIKSVSTGGLFLSAITKTYSINGGVG